MHNSMAFDFFISYSHYDKDWVHGFLVPTLKRSGARVITDQDFEPGFPSAKEMERAVRSSRKFLAVITDDYLKSKWSEFESLLIQYLDPSASEGRLVPIILKEYSQALPLRLAYLVHLDFSTEEKYADNLRKLISDVKGNLPPVSSAFRDVRPRVLVVEDSPAWQKTLVELLVSEDLQVEAVSDFTEGLRTILSSIAWIGSSALRLCVVDIGLKGPGLENDLDGLGLLAQCKVSQIPTVVVSAQINSSERETLLKSNYDVMAIFKKEEFNELLFLENVNRILGLSS